MPSIVLNGPASGLLLSGCTSPVNILSGALAIWSGSNRPIGGVAVRVDISGAGNAYILSDTSCLYSGSMTQSSGTFPGSGICGLGISDGMQIPPGGTVFVQRTSFLYDASGNPQIWTSCDPAGSGILRIFWHADLQIIK